MPKFEIVKTEFEGYDVKVPVIPNLAQLILEQVEKDPKRFEMWEWHSRVTHDDDLGPEPKDYKKCGTAHCVAGWAIVVAGNAGIKLERKLHTGDAAQLLFEHSALGEFPSFYRCNEDALEDLRNFAAREADAIASMALDGKKAK